VIYHTSISFDGKGENADDVDLKKFIFFVSGQLGKTGNCAS